MNMFPDDDTDVLEKTTTSETDTSDFELVVFNDDFNTFDHVTSTLIKVCKHNPHQAEQCTWIIHHKGKCTVKHGTIEFLTPMKDAICDRGIEAKIL